MLAVVLLFLSVSAFSQPLPCPPINTTSVTATGATTICKGSSATLGEIPSTTVKSTSSYQFSRIPYLPTTFTGTNSVLVGEDDIYSALIPLPFPFCFYGKKYNSCVIGANGEICFTASVAGGGCPWSIAGPIPTPLELNPATLNCIMGVYQDIDPGIGGNISWAIYGAAPCRTFVVSWNNVPYFDAGFCPVDTGTQQIVLYESTYAIDIFVKHKPICTAWNSGLAILGLCDATGANYNIPAEYNATTFAIDDSGYRFTPSGPAVWSYKWTGPSGVIGTTPTVVVSPTVTTSYVVDAVASSGCDSYLVSSPVTVTVAPDPVVTHVTVSNTNLCGVCNGSIVLYGLIPGDSDTLTYTLGGLPQSTVIQIVAPDSSITLSGLCVGIYDSFAIKQWECVHVSRGPYTVGGPPPPVLTLTGSTNPSQCGYCDGNLTIQTIEPFASDTVFFRLSGVVQPKAINIAEPDGSIFLPGLCAGAYLIDSVKVGPCPSIVTGEADLVAPPLKALFTDSLHYGCHGDSVFYFNASTSAGVMYYIWNFGDGYSDTTANPMHIFHSQGIFTTTLITNNHICVDSFKLQDSIVHVLNPTFVDTPLIPCQDSLVTFTNTTVSTSDNITGYEWLFGDGSTSNAINVTHVFKNSGVYNVQLIARDFISCYDTFSMKIPIDSTTALRLSITDSVICRSSYVTFYGNYTSIGNIGVTWDFGDGDSVKNQNPVSHAYDNPGTYTVALRTYYRSCRDTSTTHSFTIYPQPTVNLGGPMSICPGSNAITIGDTVNQADTLAKWLWSTGQTTPTIVVSEPGNYGVTVTIHGCSSTDTVFVANDCYMNIPNVFTPNGDGMNDYFFPRGMLTKGLISFSMNIYNRWGQLVFTTTSLDGAGWDGKFNDMPQPEGVYVYVIDGKFKDGQKEHHQGNITLLR